MIQLLYTVILTEMLLILALLFKTPLRKLVIMALDRVKRGKGPVMVKTVASTIFVVLLSSVYSMVGIQQRTEETGVLNPMDQVLMARNMLDASLMGFVLFLSLMIDRLHHYIRELRLLRKTMVEANMKQNRGGVEDNGSAEEANLLREEINYLLEKISTVETKFREKDMEAMTAQAKAEGLLKLCEEMKLEFDRVRQDYEINRIQLDSVDRS